MLRFAQDPDTLVNPTNEGKQDGKGTARPELRYTETRPRHPHVIPWIDAASDK